MTWAKSGRCESSGCVEVDVDGHQEVRLRNSTKSEVMIDFPADRWLAVLGDLRDLTKDWAAADEYGN